MKEAVPQEARARQSQPALSMFPSDVTIRCFSRREAHISPSLSSGGIQPRVARLPRPRKGRSHNEAI